MEGTFHNDIDPTELDGLERRLTGNQVIDSEDDGDFLALLDETIDAVQGTPTVLFMNKTQTSTRRHFTPQEKVCILKRHLLEDTPVSDLCDEFGIAPSLFYRWQKEFFENGHLAFDNGRKSKAEEDAKNRKIEFLEAKLARKNEVLAELLEEHTQLKKELGEP